MSDDRRSTELLKGNVNDIDCLRAGGRARITPPNQRYEWDDKGFDRSEKKKGQLLGFYKS